MDQEIKAVTVEGVLTITKNNELLAIVFHDVHKRSQIFYECKEMGMDEVKLLLEKLIR